MLKTEFNHLEYDMDGIKRAVDAPVKPKHKILGLHKKKNRICRICNKAMGPSRYFNHKDCITTRIGEYYDLADDYGL